MKYKENWEKSKERYNGFWNNEIIDRCIVHITAPRNKSLKPELKKMIPKTLEEKWLDMDFRINEFEYECANTYFGGDAFSGNFVNLGPGVIASFITNSYVLGEDTVWFDRNPIIKDWSGIQEIKLNKEAEYYKILNKMVKIFSDRANGEYIMGISDIGGNFDILASLRDTEHMLYDMYDYPEEIKKAILEINEIWFKIFNKQYDLIKNSKKDGMTTWMPIWSKDKWYPLQCDFSAMLSPEMFEEFVKPALSREAKFFGKTIYHWDGPGQIKHLEHLLDIDEIVGLQWTPGAGNEDVTDERWFPFYKKMQEKNKRVVILAADPKGIEKLMNNISSKGLFIHTSCETEDEARELEKKVFEWTRE